MKEQPIDTRDLKIIASFHEFPKTFCLDKKRMKIKNQWFTSSCAAHAMCTILEYHAGGEKLSTNFLYGIRRKLGMYSGKGMYIRDALKIANHYGDMEYADCPGNNEITGVFEKAEAAFENTPKIKRAEKYKIDSYYLCEDNNTIKFALMEYGPVLISTKWSTIPLWKREKGHWVIWLNEKFTDTNHAMVIIGWNEAGWIVQNSWGKCLGYCTIPFDWKLNYAYAVRRKGD